MNKICFIDFKFLARSLKQRLIITTQEVDIPLRIVE
jgi:hypothetical protein